MTDQKMPTYGHFVKREVSELGGIEGAERTTPQKKKDRLVSIASA
ncbi:MAG: hypothetical protein AB2556_26390 [Candidatus Thiodiazotropha sp.]